MQVPKSSERAGRDEWQQQRGDVPPSQAMRRDLAVQYLGKIENGSLALEASHRPALGESFVGLAACNIDRQLHARYAKPCFSRSASAESLAIGSRLGPLFGSRGTLCCWPSCNWAIRIFASL